MGRVRRQVRVIEEGKRAPDAPAYTSQHAGMGAVQALWRGVRGAGQEKKRPEVSFCVRH